MSIMVDLPPACGMKAVNPFKEFEKHKQNKEKNNEPDEMRKIGGVGK